MSRRAFILLTVLAISWQWLAVGAVSAQGQSDQAADPIVQAQWSALVEAASNAQQTEGNTVGVNGTGLNGSASVDASSSLLVPQVSNVGNSGGVDIINESLKYHNSPGISMQPGMSNMQGNGMFGRNVGQAQGYQMGNNFNGYGMQNGMPNNGMMNGMSNNGMMNGMSNNGMINNGMNNNFVMPAGGYPMQNQMMMNSCNACQHQNHCCGGHNSQQMMGNGNGMQNNGSQDGLNTQAIGVLGATALMGVFMQKGGVGGILQDIGWDGNRHTRGSSIGGY